VQVAGLAHCAFTKPTCMLAISHLHAVWSYGTRAGRLGGGVSAARAAGKRRLAPYSLQTGLHTLGAEWHVAACDRDGGRTTAHRVHAIGAGCDCRPRRRRCWVHQPAASVDALFAELDDPLGPFDPHDPLDTFSHIVRSQDGTRAPSRSWLRAHTVSMLHICSADAARCSAHYLARCSAHCSLQLLLLRRWRLVGRDRRWCQCGGRPRRRWRCGLSFAASSTDLSTATFFLLGLDMPIPLGRLPPMPGAAHTVGSQLGQLCYVLMQRRGVVRCAWAAWRRGKPALKLAGVCRRSRKLCRRAAQTPPSNI
jgi:hypothetical protein